MVTLYMHIIKHLPKCVKFCHQLTLHLRVPAGVPPLPRVPRPLLGRQLVHLADHLLAPLVADGQQVQEELLREIFANL